MLTLGQKAGKWMLEDLVSLGVPRTFRARHVEAGTPALVKLQPLSTSTQEQQKRELEALRALRHPCVPEVLDFGVEHGVGVVWTVFGWHEGEALVDLAQRGQLEWREAARILYDLATALAHVHRAGLVHRDLRPANVTVGETRSWLTGFDFAMSQTALEGLATAPFGDLAYLAPEVLRDPTHHGAKADVYAFGCMAFEILSGRSAFPAAAWGERSDQATRMLEWKTRASALDPGAPVPDWLRALVTKCTDPATDRRLPDLDSLVGLLDGARSSWAAQLAPIEMDEDAGDDQATEVRVMPPLLRLAMPSLAPSSPPSLASSSPPSLASSSPPSRSSSSPPSLAPPSPPQKPSAATPGARLAPAPSPSFPSSVQYATAAALGCLSAVAFSAVLILVVEMSTGTL